MCRVLCDTIIARSARFHIKLSHYQCFTRLVTGVPLRLESVVPILLRMMEARVPA